MAGGNALAAKVGTVEIRGLDAAMEENVRLKLTLSSEADRELNGRRIGHLVRSAEDETREALEPFGYYDPKVEVERSRVDDVVNVVITVDPGEPVRVRNADIAMIGKGNGDRYLREDLGAFTPNVGDVFDHALYESSKARISHRLLERGYFDAAFSSHRVEVTRADLAADIDLVWDSGARYDMGTITFEQTPQQIIDADLLAELVYWKQGEYFHQGRLDRLRKSLVALDYFSRIDIQVHPEQAVDNQVPVDITLTPAKRSVYTAGLSYGTEIGAGVRFGIQRRYLNSKGHKALAQIDYGQKLKTLTLQYRIPAFAWLDGWYTASLQAADEQTDYVDSRRVELVGSRSGQISREWTAVASLHALRERWRYFLADDGDGALAPLPDYQYGTFIYPSLRGDYVNADDRLFPRKALALTMQVKAAAEGVGSDASFAQLYGFARWYRGLGSQNRLILRGQVGHTYTDDLVNMPPSLRFYAGGDRSIRGYDYNEVGPSVDTDFGPYYTGAKNLLTGSVEFEHYFPQYFGGNLGAAVFVDTGSAFDNNPDWRTGVGIGVRYKTPVGPVRLDIARGLDDPDSSFTIGLNIGAEF